MIRRCTIVCVGKPKGWAAEASEDYAKRLRRYFPVDTIEVPEEDINRRSREDVLSKEGDRILKRLPAEAYVISLDREKGKQLPSEKLAEKLEDLGVSGRSHVAFAIGGPPGPFPRSIAKLPRTLLLRHDHAPSRLRQNRPPRTNLPRSQDKPKREIPLVASLRAAANQHFSISAGQHFSMGMDVRTKFHKQAPPVALLL